MWKNPFFTFSNVRKGFPHIFQCEERISSHFPMWRNPFLTLENVKKGFPHILNVWNWLKWISSHFPHTRRSWKNQKKNSSHFSNVWNFGKRSFPYINSTHAENSSLFPDIFLTFSSHWNFIVKVQNKKKKEIESFKLVMRGSAAAALA